MGNFEKLVVLTVLFLSAIVLAVQLNDDDETLPSDPSQAAREVLDGRPVDPPDAFPAVDGAAEPTRDGRSPDPDRAAPGGAEETGDPGTVDERRGPVLLDSGVGGDADAPMGGPARPRTSPYGPDCIVLLPGLEEAWEGVLTYRLEEPTTWEALAEELYGDARYAALLQLNNEELFDAPEPGPIVVPMQDNTRAAGIVGSRVPRELTPAPPSRDPLAGATGADAASRPERPRTGDAPRPAGRSYVVQDGDNLSKIAARFYGATSRWEAIYQANRDQLDSPDWVKPGMTLILPGVAEEAKPGGGVR